MKVLSLLVFCAAVLLVAMCATSCSAIASAISGDPIPASAVTRVTSPGDPVTPEILVVSADLARAERGNPETIYGLYDAGKIAEAAREQVIKATK